MLPVREASERDKKPGPHTSSAWRGRQRHRHRIHSCSQDLVRARGRSDNVPFQVGDKGIVPGGRRLGYGLGNLAPSPRANHPLRPHSASQRPVLSWTVWPTRTHHGCSVDTLASGVQGSTTFSCTLALRARAWAPNFRARLRQDWSSEMESSEGTWGHRYCQFCK